MLRTRWILLAIACLAAITPLVTSSGTVAAAPGPKSNKPTVLYFDDTFEAPNLTRECGFPVTAHFVGTISVSVHPNGVQIERVNFRRNFIGPVNSLTVVDVGVDKITQTVSPDGNMVVLSITTTGSLPYHQVVPGHGSIGNNSGHEILQITLEWDEELGEYVEVDFQVLFDAGPNDELTDEDFAVICDYLAGN
jgi:hypothetical protein